MTLVPQVYRVMEIAHDTPDVFTLILTERESGKGMRFLPGQFNMLYPFGAGESAMSISGDPQDEAHLIHTIKAVGAVTCNLQRLKKGDEIGVRGPYGSHWPMPEEGTDVLVIAGGLGIAPLRPLLYRLAAARHRYKRIALLYGTKTPAELIYKEDIAAWEAQGMEISISVDTASVDWQGHLGVVTALISGQIRDPQKTTAFLCGPENMMQFAIQELLSNAVNEKNIYLSMERNMHCAVGFCGHCLYGPYFICKDGPVFAYEQVKKWLQIKEL